MLSGLLCVTNPYISRKLSTLEKIGLYGRIMLHVFGGCTQSYVHEFTNTLNCFDWSNWKKNYKKQGELYKNSKFYLYSRFTIPATPTKAGISKEEAEALRLAAQFQPLIDFLSEMRDVRKCHPLTVEKLDGYIGKVLTSKDIKDYTGKYINAKMRFLITSYGQTYGDLFSKLINSAYFGLIKQYPNFENFDHLYKLAKVTIHNAGVNIIMMETSQKRNVLEQHADGTYFKNTMDIDVLSNDDTPIATSFLVTGLDGTYQSLWEEKFSLRELAKSPKLNDNHKLYLRLLLGEVDEGFVNFMGGPYSNLFDEDYSAYTAKVCEYLGLSKTRSASFLQSLQKHL